MLINYPFHFSPSTRGAIVHFCLMASFITFMRCYFWTQTLSLILFCLLTPSLLSFFSSDSPATLKQSPSLCELSQSCTRIHTAVHVNPLTCMLTRSLCWCSCVWCEARSILFPGRPSGVRTPAHSSPRSLALSPSSLSFFLFFFQLVRWHNSRGLQDGDKMKSK